MKNYNEINNKFINNGISIAEDLLTDIERLKIDRITDELLLRYLDYFSLQIGKIINTIYINPRFNWIKIQQEIDRLYRVDNSYSGIRIILNWREGDNLAFYTHNIIND